MTPAQGNYPPDQQITLYVSGGGVSVPNVVNDTEAEAQAVLQQQGFSVTTSVTPASADQMVPPGTVWNQSPGAESVAQKGSSILIFVQPQTTITTSPTATPTDTGTPTTTPTATPTDTTPTPTPTDTSASPGNGGTGQGGGTEVPPASGP